MVQPCADLICSQVRWKPRAFKVATTSASKDQVENKVCLFWSGNLRLTWSKIVLSKDLTSKFKRCRWPNKTWPTRCWLLALDLNTRQILG